MLAVTGIVASALLFVLSGVEGVWCPTWCCEKDTKPEPLPPYPRECQTPAEGWWTIEHNYPTGYCRSTLVHQAHSQVYLKREFGNVYRGVGRGGLIGTPFPSLENRLFDFLAWYNDKSCRFAGSLYDFGTTINDVVGWYHNSKDDFSGPYINCGYYGRLLYRTKARHDVSYSEEQGPPPPELTPSIEETKN